MSSVTTYSDSGLYNETELACLLGFRPELLGFQEDSSGEPKTEPHAVDVSTIVQTTLSAIDQKACFMSDYIDSCIDYLRSAVFTPSVWKFNSHLAIMLWLKKINATKSDTISAPLVDPQDIKEIKSTYSAFSYGIKTEVSKELIKAPDFSHHKMLRAFNAAQLLWQESFESDIQDE